MSECPYRRSTEINKPSDEFGAPGVGSRGWHWCAAPAGKPECATCPRLPDSDPSLGVVADD